MRSSLVGTGCTDAAFACECSSFQRRALHDFERAQRERERARRETRNSAGDGVAATMPGYIRPDHPPGHAQGFAPGFAWDAPPPPGPVPRGAPPFRDARWGGAGAGRGGEDGVDDLFSFFFGGVDAHAREVGALTAADVAGMLLELYPGSLNLFDDGPRVRVAFSRALEAALRCMLTRVRVRASTLCADASLLASPRTNQTREGTRFPNSAP